MRFSRLLFALATVGALIASFHSRVGAANAQQNLQVTATVNANCTITTATVAFPAYDPIVTHASASMNDDGTGAVLVTCTRGTAATIGLGLGANASGSQRRMKLSSGADTLNYELYRDSTRASVWGNVAPNLLTPAQAPDKNQRSFTVYGRILGGQDVSAGSYSDTVVATVNF